MRASRTRFAVGPLLAAPALALAQASPFLTGATALQTNILAWLTPIAIILVIAQVSSTYGTGEAQTIVENCGNTLILRCSGSEHGGTSQFASRLIGDREVMRTTTSRSRRANDFLSTITRAEHLGIEAAVMGSQIEQLPDFTGYLKLASHPEWRRVHLHQLTQCEHRANPRIPGRILSFPRRQIADMPHPVPNLSTEHGRAPAIDGAERE